MKLPVATCDPRPGRLGPILAEPTTLAPSTAATVRPGGWSIHHGRASSSERFGGKAYVRPAATMMEKKG